MKSRRELVLCRATGQCASCCTNHVSPEETEHCRWHGTRRPLECRGPARWPPVRGGGQPQPGTAAPSATERVAGPRGLNWGPRRSDPHPHRGRPHHPSHASSRRRLPPLLPRGVVLGERDRRSHCLLSLPALPAVVTCRSPTMIAARAVRAAAALRTLSRASMPRPPVAVAPAACVGAAAAGARFMAATASPTTTSTTPPTPTAADAKVRISRRWGLGGGGANRMRATMAAAAWLLTVLGQRERTSSQWVRRACTWSATCPFSASSRD